MCKFLGMLSKLNALVFLFLAPSLGEASFSCKDLFSIKHPLQFHLGGSRSQLGGTIQDAINQLDPLLTHMRSPKNVSVELADFMAGPGDYDPVTQILRVKVSLRAKGFTTSDIQAVAQHEFGHSVFDANLGIYIARWDVWYNLVTMPGLWGAIAYNKLGRRFHSPISAHIALPYAELFSDLLAVVAQKNPNAIHDLVVFETQRSQDARSFGKTVLDSKWSAPDPHDMLSPVRNFLWSNYFSKGKNQDKKAELIKAIFDVLATEILTRMTNKEVELTPEEMNMRLLNLLAAGLKDFE